MLSKIIVMCFTEEGPYNSTDKELGGPCYDSFFSLKEAEPQTPHCELPVAPVSLDPAQQKLLLPEDRAFVGKAQSDSRGVWLRSLNPAPKVNPHPTFSFWK